MEEALLRLWLSGNLLLSDKQRMLPYLYVSTAALTALRVEN
jgi:hypothetical protein